MLFLLNGRLIMIPIIYSWIRSDLSSAQLLIIAWDSTRQEGQITILGIAQRR